MSMSECNIVSHSLDSLCSDFFSQARMIHDVENEWEESKVQDVDYMYCSVCFIIIVERIRVEGV
jgi:hypothetical protein